MRAILVFCLVSALLGPSIAFAQSRLPTVEEANREPTTAEPTPEPWRPLHQRAGTWWMAAGVTLATVFTIIGLFVLFRNDEPSNAEMFCSPEGMDCIRIALDP